MWLSQCLGLSAADDQFPEFRSIMRKWGWGSEGQSAEFAKKIQDSLLNKPGGGDSKVGAAGMLLCANK